jgi:hypothetical protein
VKYYQVMGHVNRNSFPIEDVHRKLVMLLSQEHVTTPFLCSKFIFQSEDASLPSSDAERGKETLFLEQGQRALRNSAFLRHNVLKLKPPPLGGPVASDQSERGMSDVFLCP